jgi:hypothetical protein
MESCCRVCNTGEAAVEGCYLGRSVPRKVAAAGARCTTDGRMHSLPFVDAEVRRPHQHQALHGHQMGAVRPP